MADHLKKLLNTTNNIFVSDAGVGSAIILDVLTNCLRQANIRALESLT